VFIPIYYRRHRTTSVWPSYYRLFPSCTACFQLAPTPCITETFVLYFTQQLIHAQPERQVVFPRPRRKRAAPPSLPPASCAAPMSPGRTSPEKAAETAMSLTHSWPITDRHATVPSIPGRIGKHVVKGVVFPAETATKMFVLRENRPNRPRCRRHQKMYLRCEKRPNRPAQPTVLPAEGLCLQAWG
jgi:hypothetical protein